MPDSLMNHVRHLSVVIGPRPPTSPAEREAAAYIHATIRALSDDWYVINQPFRCVGGFKYRIAPLALLTGLSLLFGLGKSRRRQLVSGAVSTGLSTFTRDAFLERPMVWESWLPRRESENVIVRIPPRGKVQQRVVLVAHMDSGVHRLTADPHAVRHLPRTLGGLTLLALVGGVLTALAGRNQRWRVLRTLIAGSALGGAALAIIDEMGPDVPGSNSNASGVAALLGVAGALHVQPLESTEIVLAFTGGATAVAAGADTLATAYGQEWQDALWVVVNSVGSGDLCWVTRHGISPYAHYHPHPEAERMMERVAEVRPDLGLMGKSILTLDEVAILRDRDLRAVALTGYDRVTGLVPHWRQNSDTIHEINPVTITRAAETLVTLVQMVDQEQ